MDQSQTTHQVKIDHLWKAIRRTHEFSLEGLDSQLGVFTQLTDLVDKKKDPQFFCQVLRKRAQFHSLATRFDDALTDLRLEREIARSNNLNHIVEDIDHHITRLTFWSELIL